jgi:uncharacterized glyoxalase superfamily protein PhnB
MEYPTVFPTLHYDDAGAAIEFLIAAFGAEKHAVYDDGKGTIVHAELRLGNGIVMLGPARPDAPATGGKGGGIYVVVENADAHCAKARDAGAAIVRELNDTEYGSREYGARDPEGNVWDFGTYQPFAFDHEAAAAATTT